MGNNGLQQICDVLRDLVPFVQFKKREKHPWRSVILQMVPNATHHTYQRFTNCDALRNLVLFVQLKKCEKHSSRSVTFSKVTACSQLTYW